jgi:chloramphenicol-sensitive protein RarD
MVVQIPRRSFMEPNIILKSRKETLFGVAYAVSGFLIWGMSPVYWKELGAVPAFEIIMHRTIWSLVFLLPFLLIQRRWHELASVFKNPRLLLILTATAIILAGNWLIFIWAINHGHVLQSSLGYYINPLISVLLGMVILRERLRRAQIVALLMATVGVLQLTIQFGQFPWIALTLGMTFGFYGLIRKVAPVGALVGLSVETMLLSVPALGYLITRYASGSGAFLRIDIKIDLFLMGTALFTALPLLLFTLGMKRLHLSTIGFMQYIVPSLFFIFAVFFFHEPISKAQIWTFIIIWLALCVYSADSAIHYRYADRALFENS